MDAWTGLMLLAAGLAGGVVTAIVGGSSLITFPAMLAAGLPPVIASASNTIALTPSTFVAAAADFERMPPWRAAYCAVAAVAVLGGAGGALLLLWTPETAFMAMVPLLIGAATALFAFAGKLRARMHRRAESPAARSRRADRLGLALLAPAAVYGGYFGAGLSVMFLAILSLGSLADFRAINVLKNLLSGLTSAVAVVVFIVQGAVSWPETLAMMAGALTGGFAGGRLVRALPAAALYWIVVVAGCIFTAMFARRFWWGA
ncbi:MAG: sulfite exporter TauE/SafE family protein [Rhodospirillales bacterium]